MVPRAKTLLLCLAAVLAVSGVSESPASAAPELIWKVEGKTLAAGESRAVKTEEAKGVPFKIVTTLLEKKVEVECENLVSKNGTIRGGVPGKYESTLELSKCKAVGLSSCSVKEPIEAPVKAELVENAKEEKVLILFTPKSGEKVFTEVSLTGSLCALKGKYPVEGNFAGEITPQKEEAKELQAHFPSPPVKEVVNSKKETIKVETFIAKQAAELIHTVFCVAVFLFGVF